MDNKGEKDRNRRWRQKARCSLPWIAYIGIIIVASYLVSRNYFQLMLIQGDSMNPSYHNLQLVVLDKRDRDYGPGDVVAFACEEMSGLLVKRIAAVPGDAVQISGGTLYVNGEKSAVYPDEGAMEYAGIASEGLVLAEGEYFVLGDNLAESKDSRYEQIGTVDAGDIAGKVWPGHSAGGGKAQEKKQEGVEKHWD